MLLLINGISNLIISLVVKRAVLTSSYYNTSDFEAKRIPDT